ncbi:MAG: hypothetical protein HY363_04390 [Candidatus Aenigmarchaeota archaeon]|nr:hypothetical protein [Candidatus Aenigmarchaeota archaeon]
MAKISIENISRIELNVIPFERKFDLQGDAGIDTKVRDAYVSKNYDAEPKSKQEADAQGKKGFNGLMSSFTHITVHHQGDETIVVADIAPTRYLIGQAMRDVVKASAGLSAEDVKKLSPDMANVSLVAPVKVNGQYFLLSQIKGKALGSGEIHAGLVAGNIDGKYLKRQNPLVAALQEECSEELGMDLSTLDHTSATYMLDERETGQVNFAFVARNTDADKVLDSYDTSARTKLITNEPLEVMALSLLPVAGIALVPLEGTKGLRNIECYKPTAFGLEKVHENRGIRPYTQATLDYLAEPKNLKFLLEKAGF